jgi:hypothetical protein
MMPTLRRLAIVAGALAGLLWAAPAATAQTFVNLNFPYGVEVDGAGNVFATNDQVAAVQLTKFTPAAQPIVATNIGGIQVGQLGSLAIDPATGGLWHVAQDGTIRIFDPNTLAATVVGSVADLPTDARNVYDANVGMFRDFTGNLLVQNFVTGQLTPANSRFGDIALLRSADNNRLDVFVSARNTSNFRSIIRLTFVGGAFQPPARSVISSSALSAFHNQPPGVAVNRNGTVVTTLGFCTGAVALGQCADLTDYVFTFPASLPETLAQGPQPRRLTRPNISMRGADSDNAGNFYLASQVLATSICGDVGATGIAVLLPDGRFLGCTKQAGFLTSIQDIAVSPGGDLAYVTLPSGSIARLGRLAPPTADLSVQRDGDGSVSSDPEGIACGNACTAAFARGAQVTLQATPGAGSSFAGWTGPDCSGTGLCTVTLGESKNVGARFTGGGGGGAGAGGGGGGSQTPSVAAAQLRARSLAMTRRGIVSVRLTNPNQFRIGASVRIDTASAVSVKAAGRRRRLRLGSKSLRIAAARTATAKVKLTRAARRLVRRRKRLRVRVTVTVRAAAGRNTSARTLVLRASGR